MTGANSNCFETLCRMTWHPLAYCSVSAYRIDTDSGIMCCYHVECATLWSGESMDHSHDHAQLPWLEPRDLPSKTTKGVGFCERTVRTYRLVPASVEFDAISLYTEQIDDPCDAMDASTPGLPRSRGTYCRQISRGRQFGERIVPTRSCV